MPAVEQRERGLHVRFDAQDPSPWFTKTARDDRLWEEEVVEIFLDPARELFVRLYEWFGLGQHCAFAKSVHHRAAAHHSHRELGPARFAS